MCALHKVQMLEMEEVSLFPLMAWINGSMESGKRQKGKKNDVMSCGWMDGWMDLSHMQRQEDGMAIK